MQKQAALRTPAEVRSWFERTGTSISDWCKDKGLPAPVVYSLLSGRSRGRRGVAHVAALELGIKAPLPNDEIGELRLAPQPIDRHDLGAEMSP